MSNDKKCGYVAIIGRPNVGKSTLLNKILGQKISITARKPQTTRHKILGIKTTGSVQAIYLDTPGLHDRKQHALAKFMLQEITAVLDEADVIIWVVDAFAWKKADALVLHKIETTKKPVVLAVNKVDKLKNKEELLPYLNELTAKYEFADIVPISAAKGDNVGVLELTVNKLLPTNDFYYAEDELTDRSVRFLVAEIVREKLTRLLGQEVPHALTVAIEKYDDTEKLARIAAVIYVERPGQKNIVIGAKGEKLKEIGTKARVDIERLIEKKVFLQLWVKVKSNWSDDVRALHELGYSESGAVSR